jgi:hypothetical protein
MNIKKTLLCIGMVSVLLGITGCYKFVEIKRSEVVKLNNSYTIHTGTQVYGNTRVQNYIQTAKDIERIDGRMLQVKGQATVVIVTTRDKRYVFKPPIRAKFQGDTLIIAGANRANTKFVSEIIKKVLVKQVDKTKTNILSIFSGLAGGLLVTLPIILFL